MYKFNNIKEELLRAYMKKEETEDNYNGRIPPRPKQSIVDIKQKTAQNINNDVALRVRFYDEEK